MLMARQGAAHYLSLLLIALPALFFALRFLATFPLPPVPIAVYPSLAGLPAAVAVRTHQIYSEDFYGGGSYVSLPCGRVRIVQKLEDLDELERELADLMYVNLA